MYDNGSSSGPLAYTGTSITVAGVTASPFVTASLAALLIIIGIAVLLTAKHTKKKGSK